MDLPINSRLKENQLDKIWDLHLKVLKKLLQGYSFEQIIENYQSCFDDLNYLDIIKRSGNLSFNQEGGLVGAYPISPLQTNYKVEVEGLGTGFAMCAIDALGMAFTFGKKITIHCNEKISGDNLKIEINPNSENYPKKDLYITYKKHSKDDGIAALNQCPTINFYKSKELIPNRENVKILNFNQALNYASRRFEPKKMKNLILPAIRDPNYSCNC